MDGNRAVQPTDARSSASDREPPWLRRAIFLTLAAVVSYQVGAWAFSRLSSFIGLLFLSWMFAISMDPVVRVLVRRGMRRGAATGLVLAVLLLLVAGFVAAFGTLLVDQVGQLVRSLPALVHSFVGWADRTFHVHLRAQDVLDALDLTPTRIQQLVRTLTPSVLGIVTSVVGFVFQALTLILFGYFMSAQAPQLRETVSRWFPPRQQQVISTVWTIAVEKTGGYLLSRLVLAVLSSLATSLLLLVLGVPFWLPLGIWTGLVSQFIPTIGTYLGILLPAVVALAEQPIDALWVVLFGTAYQQLENYLLAPRVTARTMEIHPAVALGAVIAGAALFGPLGALVSIPVVAAIQSVIETYGRRFELVPAVDESPPERRLTERRMRRAAARVRE